jgi:hypothetical protein
LEPEPVARFEAEVFAAEASSFEWVVAPKLVSFEDEDEEPAAGRTAEEDEEGTAAVFLKDGRDEVEALGGSLFDVFEDLGGIGLPLEAVGPDSRRFC